MVELDIGEVARVPGDVGDQEAGRLGGGGIDRPTRRSYWHVLHCNEPCYTRSMTGEPTVGTRLGAGASRHPGHRGWSTINAMVDEFLHRYARREPLTPAVLVDIATRWSTRGLGRVPDDRGPRVRPAG